MALVTDADLQIAQAAWAVVLDPTPGIAARNAFHSRIEQHISEMHVQECGRCPGRQSIGRAELLALAVAFARVKNLRVVSDCKGAIDIANSLLGGQGLDRYANHQNFDVISSLHKAFHKWPLESRRITISKIKSHQQPPFALTCVRDVAGNEAADSAAKRVLVHSPPVLRNLLQVAREHKGREIIELPQILSGVVGTTRAFIQAIKSTRPARDALQERPSRGGGTADVVFDPHNRFFHFPEDHSWRTRAIWGVTFTLAALNWVQQLRWPNPGENVGHSLLQRAFWTCHSNPRSPGWQCLSYSRGA